MNAVLQGSFPLLDFVLQHPKLHHAFQQALLSAASLSVSHCICVLIIMYLDLSGRWKKYSLNKNRNVSYRDYVIGMKSFLVDLVLLFIPFMTACFWFSHDVITDCRDSWRTSVAKLICGYSLGKFWAFGMHYVLHSHPLLYHFHKRHHRDPKAIVAAAAWEDSFVEYAVMELPSFGLCVGVFPTHFIVHLVHFALHGWDGACGHSGFKGPGLLGYIFDGEYHYYHHAHLTLNYAELEFIDLLAGTHHSQHKNAKNFVFKPAQQQEGVIEK